MSAHSQASKILAHLEAGNTLTPIQALELFGTCVLHSRISELRGRGHDILCKLVRVPSGKVVGCYSLPVRVAYG